MEITRHALDAVAQAAPDGLRAHAPPEWFERYARPAEAYRLPRGAEARQALAEAMGRDGMARYAALGAGAAAAPSAGCPRWISCAAPVSPGTRSWTAASACATPRTCPRWPGKSTRPRTRGALRAQARDGLDRVQAPAAAGPRLTEACEDDAPHPLTQAHTTTATAADVTELGAGLGWGTSRSGGR